MNLKKSIGWAVHKTSGEVFERGFEHGVSIKCGEFLDYLRNY
jgi:hypothetical protein